MAPVRPSQDDRRNVILVRGLDGLPEYRPSPGQAGLLLTTAPLVLPAKDGTARPPAPLLVLIGCDPFTWEGWHPAAHHPVLRQSFLVAVDERSQVPEWVAPCRMVKRPRGTDTSTGPRHVAAPTPTQSGPHASTPVSPALAAPERSVTIASREEASPLQTVTVADASSRSILAPAIVPVQHTPAPDRPRPADGEDSVAVDPNADIVCPDPVSVRSGEAGRDVDAASRQAPVSNPDPNVVVEAFVATSSLSDTPAPAATVDHVSAEGQAGPRAGWGHRRAKGVVCVWGGCTAPG